MASPITFSGLASGLDTSSLISQLVAAARAPANVITQKQSDITSQQGILSNITGLVGQLGTVMQGMTLQSDLQPRVASSSDSHVTVSASTGAAATVHDIRVQQVARGQITSSNSFSSLTGVVGTGSLTIVTGSKTASISYSPSDSLSDIASRINNANVGASASVLYDGSSYRLMVAATGTGTANAPQFTESGDALGLSDPNNIKIPAQDAKATIDGVSVTRSTNTITDAIPNVSITLNSAQASTDPDTNVTVGLDTSSLTTQLNSFVSAYNAVNAALANQLEYTGSTAGTDTLFGDSTMVELQGSLGTLMSSAYGGNAIDSLGLARDDKGNLSLNTDTLDAALANNPDAVSDFFATGGFGAAAVKLTDAYTEPGDGILTAKTTSLTDQYNQLQTQADDINSRATQLQTTLQTQFNSLETAMSNLKSQSSYITSVLG